MAETTLPVRIWIRWFDWRFVGVLLLAVVMRAPYVSVFGHSDLNYFYNRAISIEQNGLFDIYAQDEGGEFNYPPLYLGALGVIGLVWSSEAAQPAPDSPFLQWHKWFQVGVDLVLIGLVYWWLPRQGYLRWALLLLLAVYPALILTSAFWGQIDTLWTLFLVASLVALNRDQPRWAGVWFTLAILTKFQAVLLAPLLLTLSWRRYGGRTTGMVIALSVALFVAVLAPFALVSGVERTLRPFTVAVDFFPSTTIWALNLWYILNPMTWGSRPPLFYDTVADDTPLIGALTAKQVGLGLFAVYTLFVCVMVWRQAAARREFIWASALSFGFFMLPTQMHERYLHPAAIFTLLGVVQDRRMWTVTLGTLFTYSYNVIVPTHAPFEYLGVNLLFRLGDISLHVAWLNMILFAWVTWIAFTLLPDSDHPAQARTAQRWIGRWVWGVGGLAAGVLVLAIALHTLLPDRPPDEAQPLDTRLGDHLHLEGYQLQQQGQDWTVALYWRASAHTNDSFTVFVHAVQDGATIAQCDSLPQDGNYPTWRWFNNRLVETTCLLHLPDNAPPDAIYAGLYDAATLTNLPVVQAGAVIPERRVTVYQTS